MPDMLPVSGISIRQTERLFANGPTMLTPGRSIALRAKALRQTYVVIASSQSAVGRGQYRGWSA